VSETETDEIIARLDDLAAALGERLPKLTDRERFDGLVKLRGEHCFALAWLGHDYNDVVAEWDDYCAQIDELLDNVLDDRNGHTE
jgi:hypothetical protein